MEIAFEKGRTGSERGGFVGTSSDDSDCALGFRCPNPSCIRDRLPNLPLGRRLVQPSLHQCQQVPHLRER